VRRFVRLIVAAGLLAGLGLFLRDLLGGRTEAAPGERSPERSEQAPHSGGPGGNGASGLTRRQLYEEAKRLGIEGRSQMSKSELERALASHEGGGS
jgi:hypothetical protein